MADTVIQVEGISKEYIIGRSATAAQYGSLAETMARRLRSLATLGKRRQSSSNGGPTKYLALQNVSFDIKRGEVVGIIGRNGAGKSTLLKILSRITDPTKGRAVIEGRVASLLEVGTGFHPELTGRENVFLNGAILGMSKYEISQKFDEIVDFANVEAFIDTPVKRYSSGMYVRLAFAVAAHLEPEVLLVDEVLSVGDAEFQQKCIGKIREVSKDQARTVLFVSHNLPSVQQLCTRGIVLNEGSVSHNGSIESAIAHYMQSMSKIALSDIGERTDRQGDGRLKVVGISFHDEEGERIETIACGKALRVRLHYESEFDGDNLSVDAAFNLRNDHGTLLTCFANIQTGPMRLKVFRKGYFECYWPKVNIRSGRYTSTVYVALDRITSDWIHDAFQIRVEEGNYFGTGFVVSRYQGEFLVEQTWLSASE